MSEPINEHVMALYHALNLLLPGYRMEGDRFVPIAPHPECPAHDGLSEAEATFNAHQRCCGDQYDEWIRDAVLRATSIRGGT